MAYVSVCVVFILTMATLKFGLVLTTDPPPTLMARNLEEQVGCAKRAGFVFNKPMLRITKWSYVSGTPHGWADYLSNTIILVSFASYDTLGHELGHIIDRQTGRKGHPFFVGKEKMYYQTLADAIRDVILRECKFSEEFEQQ